MLHVCKSDINLLTIAQAILAYLPFENVPPECFPSSARA